MDTKERQLPVCNRHPEADGGAGVPPGGRAGAVPAVRCRHPRHPYARGGASVAGSEPALQRDAQEGVMTSGRCLHLQHVVMTSGRCFHLHHVALH